MQPYHMPDVISIGAPASDNCTEGELRLVSDQSPLEGTVQFCAFGYWGTICRNSWDSREVHVVCNQFGYPALGNN